MACLVLPRDILAEIKRISFRTANETGVRLIGEARGGSHVVRHIIGPGRRAVHRSDFYECDNQYAEDRFNELWKREPGLQFLGEIHVHPNGEPELSVKDLATVRKVLTKLPFFIAGTIQRQPFRITPVLFNRGSKMRLHCVLRQEPAS
jgi:integrative and conjugative element protein (TIGR02256 family)